MKTSFLLIFLVIFLWASCFSRMVFAAMGDLESAIIDQDYRAAQGLAQKMLSQSKDTAERQEIQYYLGLSLLGLKRYPEAGNVFQKIMTEKPSGDLKDKAWLGLIDSYALDEKYEREMSEAQAFIAQRPNSVFLSTARLKAARAQLKLSQWEKARQSLREIIKDFPDSLEAHSARQLLEEKQYFAIQVGSFLDPSRAHALAHEMNQRGEYSYVLETTDKDGRQFYRVRVGMLTSLNEARRLSKKLNRQGYPTHIYP